MQIAYEDNVAYNKKLHSETGTVFAERVEQKLKQLAYAEAKKKQRMEMEKKFRHEMN